jgi:hypothetical protein
MNQVQYPVIAYSGLLTYTLRRINSGHGYLLLLVAAEVVLVLSNETSEPLLRTTEYLYKFSYWYCNLIMW